MMKHWEDIVVDVNTDHRQIVSYAEAAPGTEGYTSRYIPYGKVKSVDVRKATREGQPEDMVQYSITFAVGFMSSESFLVPGVPSTRSWR